MARTRVDDLHKKWLKNPVYAGEYDALEEEFSVPATLISLQSEMESQWRLERSRILKRVPCGTVSSSFEFLGRYWALRGLPAERALAITSDNLFCRINKPAEATRPRWDRV